MHPAVPHDSPYCEILCCWAAVFSAILAGGGVQEGQTIGRSDKIGAYPASRPFSPADLPRPSTRASESILPPRFAIA